MTRFDTVSEVAFYPIKGCHAATVNGEVPESLAVGPTGFEVNDVRDRDWVLLDPTEGVFVSQRGWGADSKRVRYPQDRQLATVAVDIRSDHARVTSRAGQLELPAAPADGRRITLDVFGKELPVVDEGPEAAAYFSTLLGREIRLMRSDREQARELPLRYQRTGAYNEVAGADGMPFLLTSQASLAAAHADNGITAGSVPITRYRGNIVIAGDGLGAFGEDHIDTETRFSIGDIGMWAVKACSRCPVPDIDQESGERVGGALRVLRGRTGTIFTGETGVFFGQNLVHANLGSISVGDLVAVDNVSPVPNISFRASQPE